MIHDAQTGEVLNTIQWTSPIRRFALRIGNPVFRPDGRQIAALIRTQFAGADPAGRRGSWPGTRQPGNSCFLLPSTASNSPHGL